MGMNKMIEFYKDEDGKSLHVNSDYIATVVDGQKRDTATIGLSVTGAGGELMLYTIKGDAIEIVDQINSSG